VTQVGMQPQMGMQTQVGMTQVGMQPQMGMQTQMGMNPQMGMQTQMGRTPIIPTGFYTGNYSYDNIHGRKAFHCANGGWLIAEEGMLLCEYNLQNHGNKGYFHVDKHGNNQVSLRTSHNHYVAADGWGGIYLTRHHHEYETKFHLEWVNGKVAFRSHLKGFLGVAWDGEVRIVRQLGPEELFTVYECN